MRINREELLQKLSSVQPGLSVKELTEQSDAFVFQNGKVITYNDEILCQLPCDIGFEGAIRASAFLAILGKLEEDEIVIQNEENELIIKGKQKKIGLKTEQEILLPVDSVESPKEWKELPVDFLEAVQIVQQCISTNTNESKFHLTCIHFHPEWIESCDGLQAIRYTMKTGIKKSVLIRGTSIKHIISLGVSGICEGKNWMHFQNPSGLVLSCRQFRETYPDLDEILDVQGEKVSLPKGLSEAAEKAEIFTSESGKNNLVKVSLRSGSVRIQGEGPSGWYNEKRKSNYSGPPLSFMIPSKLIEEITSKYNECEIAETRLKVDGGKFVYVSCIGIPDEE